VIHEVRVLRSVLGLHLLQLEVLLERLRQHALPWTTHSLSMRLFRIIRPNTAPRREYSASFRPITAPQREYSASFDQSQPRNENIPRHPTNHSPEMGCTQSLHTSLAALSW
jgi:hypothetical protein